MLTAFNFTSISIILVFVSFFNFSPVVTSIVSQLMGLALSMWFTLDFWWKRVENRTELNNKFSDRIFFLSIGSISALLSVITTHVILGSSQSKTIELLAVNWLALAIVAFLKFILLANRFLRKSK